MRRRLAIMLVLVTSYGCTRERPVQPGTAFCVRVEGAPAAIPYDPHIHVPGLHGSDLEAFLNSRRAIGKSDALLDILPNERLQIGVSFLPSGTGSLPSAAETSRLLAIANRWGRVAHVEFVPVKIGNIRVRLTNSNVSVSAIGKGALKISRLNPTMELGLLRPLDPNEDEWIVFHEFGHALGLVHEHQNSSIERPQVCWRIDKVTEAIGNGDVAQAFVAQFSGPAYTKRRYDPLSVMCYRAPSEWTCDGRGLPMNYKFSKIDEETMADLYPRRGKRKM